MQSINLNIHSQGSLITNSSSEVYIFADKDTISGIKDLVNSLLKVADPNTNHAADTLFKFELHFENEYRDEWGYLEDDSQEWEEDDDGKPIPPDDYEELSPEDYEQDYENYKEISVRVTPLVENDLTRSIAKTLSNLTGLFDMEASYN